MNVVQRKTPALPSDTLASFLTALPPWEVLCTTCGAPAHPEASSRRRKSSAAAAAAADSQAPGSPQRKKKASGKRAAPTEEEAWPALRCAVCRRPKHVECLTPQEAKVRDAFFP